MSILGRTFGNILYALFCDQNVTMLVVLESVNELCPYNRVKRYYKTNWT